MQIDIRPGRVIFPNGSTGTSLLVAQSIVLCPIDLPLPVSVDRLTVSVPTAAVGAAPGPVELALYLADAGGRVFRCIARAEIASAGFLTTGNKDVLLDRPYSLPRGRVWQAIYNPGFATTQPTLRAIISNNHASQDIDSLADGQGLNSQSRVTRVLGVTTGCPAELETAAFTFVDNISLPYIGMRVASVNVAPRVVPSLDVTGASVNAIPTPGTPALPGAGVGSVAPGTSALPTALPTVIG